MDPGDIGGAMSSFWDNNVLSQILTYGGYAVVSAIILAALVVLFILMQYKYSVTVPILHYDNNNKAQIVGYKRDRARDVRKDGVRKQFLLMKRQMIEPFREEDIQPRNKIYILKINEDGTYVPMPRLIFNEGISAFEQLTPEEKYWAVLQLKENAKTFQSDDAQKRAMILTMFTVIFCLIMVGITVYLTMKQPDKLITSFDKWGQGFLDVANKMGGTPPG